MNDISPGRQFTYYLGLVMMAVGLIMFLSTFVVAISNFGNFSNFESNAKTSGFLAIGGMALMIIGGFVKSVGARGLAGSGVKLDPEQARKDLKPYSKMVGGMVGDVINEAKEEIGSKKENTIKVRCPKCKALNDESSKFCNQCAREI